MSVWARLVARARNPGLRAATIYLGATVLARAGAILLIPLYTRALSVEEYGDLALAQTLVTFLSTPLALGLGSAVVRQFYSSDDRAASAVRAGAAARWLVVVATLGACALSVVAVLLPSPVDGALGSTGALLCVIWAAAGGAVSTLPVAYFRASQRPLTAAAFQLGEFSANVGAGLLMVLVLQRGIGGAIEAMAVAAGLTGSVALGFVLVALPGRLEPSALWPALRFSLPLVPHGTANQIQQMSDRWILKWAGLEAQLGTYALAGQLSTPVSMAVVAWNEAVTPSMGEVRRSRGVEGLRAELPRLVRTYVLAAVAPASLIVLALPAVGLLLGERFVPSLWLVPVLCAIIIVESVYYPFANALFFADRPTAIVRVTVAAGVVNVVLNLLFIPLVGLPGAFAARLLSMGFRTLTIAWSARRALQEAAA